MTNRDQKTPVSTSTARAGEGMSFPHGRKEQTIGTKDGTVYRKRYLWYGGEYDEENAWIGIAEDDFVDVNE